MNHSYMKCVVKKYSYKISCFQDNISFKLLNTNHNRALHDSRIVYS